MKRASSLSGSIPPPGGKSYNLKPSYWKIVKCLLKRQFILKLRHSTSLIEFVGALLIYIIIYPVFVLTQQDYPNDPNPKVIDVNMTSTSALYYHLSPNQKPVLRACPDHPNVHKLVDTFLNSTFLGIAIQMATDSEFGYVDSIDKINSDLKETSENGFGFHLSNAEDKD
jgi:hypothetical protein